MKSRNLECCKKYFKTLEEALRNIKRSASEVEKMNVIRSHVDVRERPHVIANFESDYNRGLDIIIHNILFYKSVEDGNEK